MRPSAFSNGKRRRPIVAPPSIRESSQRQKCPPPGRTEAAPTDSTSTRTGKPSRGKQGPSQERPVPGTTFRIRCPGLLIYPAIPGDQL